MEPAQILTLVVGLVAATLAVAWAVVEVRRDRRQRRYALVPGPFQLGTLVVVLLAFAALLPVVYCVFAFRLVPRSSPVVFTLTLGWISVAFIGSMLAGLTVQLRRSAAGWLTLVDERTLRIDADGKTATLTLRPGGAQLYFLERPQFVQFVLTDGEVRANVWGMVGLRGLGDVTPGRVVAPTGLMLAGSAEPLRKWVTPYVAHGEAAG